MSDALAGLEPQLVWRRFGELTRIARPSHDEGAVREHVLAWAADRGFESAVDAAGNALVRVPGSTGREGAATVVLQAHLDMVCERDPDSPYDPRAGRIHVIRDGDWLLAEGTTLGADNGIGVAAAMALAEDPAVEHGPLELVFTVCEEDGLVGAKELDPALVSGHVLVNLDGTSDDAITVGCAGSAHTFVRARLDPEPGSEDAVRLRVNVSGARGGHSGGDIARGRANAIAVLGRVLRDARGAAPFGLVHFQGGVSRNAIPREAEAVVSLRPEAVPAFRQAVERSATAVRVEHAEADPDLAVAVGEAGGGGPSAGERATARVLDLLAALPLGVVSMSPTVPGTVETSTSLNVAHTDDGVVTFASMTRSSDAGGLNRVLEEIERVVRLHGAEIEVKRSYPPWQPDEGSRLLATARASAERVLGVRPHLEIVHGGLECAVLGEKLPGVEMIALGPSIDGPHAPGERLGISSTERFYRLLGALLDDLSR